MPQKFRSLTTIGKMSEMDMIPIENMPPPYPGTPPSAWLVHSIQTHGFLTAFPVILSNDGEHVVDGNRRLLAAIKAGYTGPVPVVYMEEDAPEEAAVMQLLAHHGSETDRRSDLYNVETLLRLYPGVTDEMLHGTAGIKPKRIEEYRRVLGRLDPRWLEMFYQLNIEWNSAELLAELDRETQLILLDRFKKSENISAESIKKALKEIKE